MSNTEATSILSEVPPPAIHCPFHEVVGSIRSAFMSRQPVGAETASPFVSISKFVVANDKIAEVKDAFRGRPHLVDEQPGFVQMEVSARSTGPKKSGSSLTGPMRRASDSGTTAIFTNSRTRAFPKA